MTPRRIVFASPVEPSGASWLLNCFLELGIRIDHLPLVERVWRASRSGAGPERMWLSDGDRARLHPRAAVLRKWLPALSRPDGFVFRDDLTVEYTQDFARASQVVEQPVLFVRDPRDALFSMYRRRRPGLSYPEFLEFRDGRTLLDRIDHWTLQVEGWCDAPGARWFRFEDYKRDARALLARILHELDIDVGGRSLEAAVAASSFEASRAAEARYREQHPGDTEIANRAGQPGEWRDRGEQAAEAARFEGQAGATLLRFGYVDRPAGGASRPEPGFTGAANLRTVAFLRELRVPEALAGLGADPTLRQDSQRRLSAFARAVDADLLERSRLSSGRIRGLLDSLAEVLAGTDPQTSGRLLELRPRFDDGSAYDLQRIRELLVASRPSRSGG